MEAAFNGPCIGPPDELEHAPVDADGVDGHVHPLVRQDVNGHRERAFGESSEDGVAECLSTPGIAGNLREDMSATSFINTNRNSRGKDVRNFRRFMGTRENLESMPLPSGNCEMETNAMRYDETTA